jgi:WD40 repeat protein
MAQHVVEAKLGQAVRRRIIQGAKGFGMWGIPSIDFDAKGDRLAIADGDGLYVWSLKEDRIQEYGPYNNFPIRTARFSDDGRRVLSIDASNFAIWDAETKIRAAYIGARYGAIGADGKTFFGFDDSAVLKTHSAVDGTSRQTVSPARPIQDVREVIGRTDAREYFNEVDVSPTGRWVVGPGVLLFDTSIKRHVAEFKPSTPPTRIVFAPDERSLIASDEAGKIVVWDLPAIRPRYAVPEVGTILALSADGRIVAASQGGGVNLFDVQTASLIARIDGLTGPPARAEFAPDGRTLVIGTTDGMLGFWCTTTGAPRMSARTPRAAVKSVRFSTDGRLLAVGAGHSVIVRRADR